MRMEQAGMLRISIAGLSLGCLALPALAFAADWAAFDVAPGSFIQIYSAASAPPTGKMICQVQLEKSQIKGPWLPTFAISVGGEDGKAFTLFSTTETIGKRTFGVKVTQGERVDYTSAFLGLIGDHDNFSLELYWWESKQASYRANDENQQFGQGLMQQIGFVVKDVDVSVSGVKGRALCGPEVEI